MIQDPDMVRAEHYNEIGKLICQGASDIIEKWSRFSRTEDSQESARLAHRKELRNHLPLFLQQMGNALASIARQGLDGWSRSARCHGKQRWNHGWALDELIRDYQLLRITILDYLDDQLERNLETEEVQALGLLLDDAIQDAVVTYVGYQEQHLAESEDRSRGTFENAAVGIGHVDPRGFWVRANERFCRMLGYSLDELTQTTFDHYAVPGDFLTQRDEFQQLLKGEIDSFSAEICMKHRDARNLWVKVTVSLQRGADDEPLYYIFVVEDISERRRLDIELKQAKNRAEETNRVKSEFVANVSHEIRTPLNAILGMTELALDEELSPLLQDYLNTAHESARSLLSLVNDLLDFSRMEAGRLELEATPFDLWQTVDETAKAVSISAFEKGLELLTDIASDVPRFVKGDALRLRQIITNLLSNAVKFTEQGEVLIRVELSEKNSQQTEIRFAVRDTGIGISSEDKERIFAPFTQADASTTRVFGGSGLGLAICTELISQFGGTLDVTSEVGEGSEFFFTARFQNAKVPRELVKRRKHRMGQLKGSRILIVDDNATNRTILEGDLTRFGINVEVAESGDSAISKMRLASKANQPFDVVLVDALMPGMDGFSVVEEINRCEQLQTTAVLMLSSADRSTFADRLANLHVDCYLDKPVARRELLDVLSYVSFGSDKGDEIESSLSAISQSLKVLLVEDTPANQKVVQAILRKRGHKITLANNGREAIDKLEVESFDVVLMDIQMPTVDGYQATATIRQMEDPERAGVPIIAMTAHAMKGDAGRCIEQGMNDYISKPIDSRRLIELVELWGASSSENGDTGGTDSEMPSKLESGTRKVADFDNALKRMDGNRQLLNDLIDFLRADMPELIAKIEIGVASEDVPSVRRAAHSIKGLAANFDAERVMELAVSIEAAAANGNLEIGIAQLNSLRTAVAELERVLEEYVRDH